MFEVAVKNLSSEDEFAAVDKSPLFSLPRELRDEIYGYCSGFHVQGCSWYNLRATCRRVSRETAFMFWDDLTTVQEVEDCPYEYWGEVRGQFWPTHDIYPHLRHLTIPLTYTDSFRWDGGRITRHYDLKDLCNGLRRFQGVGLQRGLCEIVSYDQDSWKILAPNLVRSLQRLTDFATVKLDGSGRCEESENWDELPFEEMAASYETMLEPTLGPFVRGERGKDRRDMFSYTFHPRAHREQVEAEVTEMMQRMFSEPDLGEKSADEESE